MAQTLKEAIVSRIKTQNGCQIWTGTMANGRAKVGITVDGKQKVVDVHRLFAVKFLRADPDKQISITTTCGDPRCLNKAHLQLADRKVKQTQRKKLNATTNAVSSNKEIFSNSVTFSRDRVAGGAGISVGSIIHILKNNTAMYPYFYLELEAKVGDEQIDDLYEDVHVLNGTELNAKYNLSHFAKEFIKSGKRFKIKDEDLYRSLLDECAVVGEHLVWVGEKRGDTPVVKQHFKQWHRASSAFFSAVYGTSLEFEPVNKCGFKDCVNPFCYEEGEYAE